MSYRLSPRASLRGLLLALLVCFASAATVVAGTAGASTLPTLSLSVTKSSLSLVGPPPPSGGANVVLAATGTKEANVILFLLGPGSTQAEVEVFLANKSKAADPNNASRFGAIVFDAEATTGQPAEAQTFLAAGQYLVLVGEGEGAPKVRASFAVSAAAAPVMLPAPAATERSIEFGFRGPSVLHDGELVRFENEGFLVHMDIAFPVRSRAAAAKAVTDLLVGDEKGINKLIAGPPVGFAGPLSSGAYQQETITAKPGWYVQACFMETQDHRDHTMLGMERVIKIAK